MTGDDPRSLLNLKGSVRNIKRSAVRAGFIVSRRHLPHSPRDIGVAVRHRESNLLPATFQNQRMAFTSA
jgi:hypothetical protein